MGSFFHFKKKQKQRRLHIFSKTSKICFQYKQQFADLSSVIKLNQVKTKALDNCSDSSRALKALPVAEESDPGPASLNHTAQREQSQTAMSCLTTTGTTASGFLIWKSHCSRPGLGGWGHSGGDYAHILSGCRRVSLQAHGSTVLCVKPTVILHK